jgi:hypothetical protein
MANPRVIFTVSEEAKSAIKRIAQNQKKAESDVMREAIEDLLLKYGESVSVDVDRGGWRGGPKDQRQTEE